MTNDEDAVEQLLQASTAGAPHIVSHYLYFPTEAVAAEAATEFRLLGFNTVERLGADGMNWLVLARHEVVPSEAAIAAARDVMEDLARTRGGEYDGWEAEVRQ